MRHSDGTYLLLAAAETAQTQVIELLAANVGVTVKTVFLPAASNVTVTWPVASSQASEATCERAGAAAQTFTPRQLPVAATLPALAMFSPIVAFAAEAAVTPSVTRARTV